MLNISWKANPSTIKALREKGPQIVSVLMSKVNRLMLGLASYVQTQKLSSPGPTTLAPRTGKLRGSIRALPTELKRLCRKVEGAGGPAFYGTYHEHGIPHPWEIVATKARFLRFIADGKVNFRKSVTHKPLQVRSFMESSLTENQEKILGELNDAIREVVEE